MVLITSPLLAPLRKITPIRAGVIRADKGNWNLEERLVHDRVIQYKHHLVIPFGDRSIIFDEKLQGVQWVIFSGIMNRCLSFFRRLDVHVSSVTQQYFNHLKIVQCCGQMERWPVRIQNCTKFYSNLFVPITFWALPNSYEFSRKIKREGHGFQGI